MQEFDITQWQNEKLNKIFKNRIPKLVKEHIEFFELLDEEYKENAIAQDEVIFSPKNIKNKGWRGFWLHATGSDTLLYKSWLWAGLVENKYFEKGLVHWYKENYPREKYVPYSIVLAEEDSKKFHN